LSEQATCSPLANFKRSILAAEGRDNNELAVRQQILQRLFAEILGKPQVRLDDSFFSLGGRSIDALKLLNRMDAIFGARVTLRRLFEVPTVRGLSERLDAACPEGSLSPVLPLRLGLGIPLFCVHPLLGLGWCYSALIKPIADDFPIYALQAHGLADDDAVAMSPEERLARYVESVESIRPAGPYALLGWSLGGNIAHAIACHLQAAGEEVVLLALIDCEPSYGRPYDDPDKYLEEIARYKGYFSVADDQQLVTSEDFATFIERTTHIGRQLGELAEGSNLRLVNTAVATLSAFQARPAEKFPGKVLVFTSADGLANPQGKSWEPYAEEVVSYEIPFSHHQMLTADAANSIGSIVSGELATARQSRCR
jgi:thioesterase domain-containing protein